MGQERYTTKDKEQLGPSPALQGRGGTSRTVGAQAMLRPRGTICIMSPPKDRAGQEAMSCPGLAAQDQAATSPDGAGKAGLRCLPSLLLPPAKVSCKSLLTPPASRVPERRGKEKVLQQEGLTKGMGMDAKGSPFPTCPHAPGETPSRGPHSGAGEHLGSPLETAGPRGTLGEVPAHSTVAGLRQPPAPFWEEQGLSSS